MTEVLYGGVFKANFLFSPVFCTIFIVVYRFPSKYDIFVRS